MVRTHRHHTFQDFYEKISPLHQHGILAEGNVFRGESSSSYTLRPSILRLPEDAKSIFNNYENVLSLETTEEFIRYEHALLEQFCILANSMGLPVPNNFSDLQRAPKPNFDPPCTWISDELAELAALSQHYGIPTRCLDWTQDIYTAIYFAAIGACKRALEKVSNKIPPFSDDDYMVIWVLKKYKLDNWSWPLKMIVPPYSENPNLCAQRGVLTYWELKLDKNAGSKPVDRTPLDLLLKNFWCNIGKYSVYSYPLERHAIPVQECIAAFRALRILGYTATRLFPGYAGAARALEEEHIAYSLTELAKQHNVVVTGGILPTSG